jgi:diguanylate cyclase (GGDEF)-like protein
VYQEENIMLGRLLICFALLLSLSPLSSVAADRVLIINGYVDGLPFPRRVKESMRDQLELLVPRVVIHSQSLDLYRPQTEEYKQLLVDLILTTYKDQVDLIITLDPLAFEFYRDRLESEFGSVPVLFSNDRGSVETVNSSEYQLLIRPNLQETFRIAKHHYPELKNIFLVGDQYNQKLAKIILGQESGVKIHELGGLPLEEMRSKVKSLERGDLLFFQLLFADGNGVPMVPPARYIQEFAASSPVPTVCMYANFIDLGCAGGSVSSPKDQATAIITAMQILDFADINFLNKDSLLMRDYSLEGNNITMFASNSLFDYKAIERFDLVDTELDGVIYLHKPEPFYSGYAKELSIALAGLILLLVAVSVYLVLTKKQHQLARRISTLTNSAPTGLLVLNRQSNDWEGNLKIEEWCKELKMTQAEFIQRIRNAPCTQGHSLEDIELRDPNGFTRFFSVQVVSNRGEPEMFTLQESTDTHQVHSLLEEQALIDPLTQLPNRRAMFNELKQWTAHNDRNPSSFAVMMLDLDGFKMINDQYGHSAGDKVLSEIGLRLKQRTRNNDVIGRLGGDEFLMLAADITKHQECQTLCEDLITLIEKPIDVNSEGELHTVSVGASIGISICPKHSLIDKELTELADKAMYQLKHLRNGGWDMFEETMLN